MLKINHGFFVKPVFGPWYFLCRTSRQKPFRKTQVGFQICAFLMCFGTFVCVKNKSWFFRETCFWTLVFFCRTSRQRLFEKHRLGFKYVRFLMCFGTFVCVKNKS